MSFDWKELLSSSLAALIENMRSIDVTRPYGAVSVCVWQFLGVPFSFVPVLTWYRHISNRYAKYSRTSGQFSSAYRVRSKLSFYRQ